jgi:integrase
MFHSTASAPFTPWNKGKLIGQRPPLKKQEIWSIRVRLQIAGKVRDLALFNLAIDSKLRGCDISSGMSIANRAMVMQQKTHQPVKFEITEQTRISISDWVTKANLISGDYLFPSRLKPTTHITTMQYARLVKNWVKMIGLDPAIYGTHSMRRTKATLIYKRTKNLRAVQLLLGHRKIESTVRYLGVEVDDALEMSEQTEV